MKYLSKTQELSDFYGGTLEYAFSTGALSLEQLQDLKLPREEDPFITSLKKAGLLLPPEAHAVPRVLADLTGGNNSYWLKSWAESQGLIIGDPPLSPGTFHGLVTPYLLKGWRFPSNPGEKNYLRTCKKYTEVAFPHFVPARRGHKFLILLLGVLALTLAGVLTVSLEYFLGGPWGLLGLLLSLGLLVVFARSWRGWWAIACRKNLGQDYGRTRLPKAYYLPATTVAKYQGGYSLPLARLQGRLWQAAVQAEYFSWRVNLDKNKPAPTVEELARAKAFLEASYGQALALAQEVPGGARDHACKKLEEVATTWEAVLAGEAWAEALAALEAGETSAG